jgi:hypothetical protein
MFLLQRVQLVLLVSYRSFHTTFIILTPLFKEFTEEGKVYGYIIKDSVTVHAVNLPVTLLEDVFSEQLMTHRLWPLDHQV